MATQTGNQQIDAALTEFAAGYYVRPAAERQEYPMGPEGDAIWLAEGSYTPEELHHWEPNMYGPGTGSQPYVKEPTISLRGRGSLGECDHAARSLTDLLRARGIEAHNNCGHDDPRARFPLDGALDGIGYSDCPEVDPIHEAHSVVFVVSADRVWTVDFAAGQYGYEQWPLVQRQGPDGWEREWPTLAPLKQEPNTQVAAADLNSIEH